MNFPPIKLIFRLVVAMCDDGHQEPRQSKQETGFES